MASRAIAANKTIGQRVYDGDIYSLFHKDAALISGGTILIGVNTGIDLATFFNISISTNSSLLELLFCEGATFTGGTPMSPISNNRNSQVVPFNESFSLNPTVSNPGSAIYDEYLVGTTELGMNMTGTSKSVGIPWLLEPNKSYVLKVTNDSDVTNVISMGLNFLR